MFGKLFLLFTLVPVVELYLLIKLGGVIGAVPTVGIILMTGGLGAYLAKGQGMRVLKRINQATSQGRIPGNELIDGLMILVGGATLLTPGLITDVLGLTLLFPVTRAMYKRLVVSYYKKRAMKRHNIIDVQIDEE